jgi:hypothetical protein
MARPSKFFTQRFERRNGNVYSLCVTHWWPYVRLASSSGLCGPGFPPTKAYGEDWPKDVFARPPFGFLQSGEPASAYVLLEGYARANVAKVRVVSKGAQGEKRDTHVYLVRVRGDLAERVGSREPFGFWASFLPPSIERYYGPPDRPCTRIKGPPAIEVIAYDGHDHELSRFGHRN